MKGGTIYKEGNRWIWKSPTYIEDGIKKRTRKSFKTEAEAIAQREKFFNLIKNKENNFIIGLTVSDAYEKWRVAEWSTEEHITYNTQRGYISVFNRHILPFVGDEKIDNLNVRSFVLHLQELADSGISQKTLNNIKQVLAKLLYYAEEIGWIDVNNIDKIKTPTAKKKKREAVVNTISNAEYKQIIDYLLIHSTYWSAISFLKNTGLRAEELAIKESDIDGKRLQVRRAIKRQYDETTEHSFLTVSEYLKSDCAYRTVPLNKEAVKAIFFAKKWKEDEGIKSDFIFCTSTGGLIEQRSLLRVFHSACDAIGIERRGLHSLRKLFCKTLKDLPCDWEQVRIIMGHDNIQTTQKYYYKMDTDDLENLAKLLS